MFLVALNDLTAQLPAGETLRNLLVVVAVFGVGFLLVLATLFTLMMTRWGQSNPLSKCVVLSLVAHFLLVSYAYIAGVLIERPSLSPGPDKEVTRVTLAPPRQSHSDAMRPPSELKPWEVQPAEAPVMPDEFALARQTVELDTEVQRWLENAKATIAVGTPKEVLVAGEIDVRSEQPLPIKSIHNESAGALAAEVEVPQAARPAPTTPAGPTTEAVGRPSPRVGEFAPPRRDRVSDLPSELISAGADVQRLADVPERVVPSNLIASVTDSSRETLPQTLPARDLPRRNSPAPGQPLPQPDVDVAAAGGAGDEGVPSAAGAAGSEPNVSAGEDAAHRSDTAGAARTASPKRLANGALLPEIYQLRARVDRGETAAQNGGNARTEAAVEAALKWLAANQSADGRWDADKFGSRREFRVLDERTQTIEYPGIEADTGVTGLAVLAFMGAGHTHYEGQYRENVQHALEFLLKESRRVGTGSMAGSCKTTGAMYCHGIGTLAIAEAYALTGDERLKWWVQKAIDYTVAAQHSTDGGWRYRPGDAGDTSQFGWQVMALKTAETSGLPVPTKTKTGVARFLSRVSAGRRGGLASYRPGENHTPSMTAEALACRYFFGMAKANDAAIAEATAYLDRNRPGDGRLNLYYWYYGTLAMHQTGGPAWQRWNEALQTRLLRTQSNDGRQAGSWDPANTEWGIYGGRVYSTAMAALCLESYYRFSLASARPHSSRR